MDKSDFDELDRAVQSLVGGEGAAGQSADNQSVPTASPVSESAEASQSASAPQSLASTSDAGMQASAERSATSRGRTRSVAERPAVVRSRSRGRFMDIVPPRPKPQARPSQQPGRTGVDLTPPSEPSRDDAPSQPAKSEPVQQPVAAESVPNEPKAALESSEVLEMQGPAGESAPAKVESLESEAKDDSASLDQLVDDLAAEVDEVIESEATAQESASPFIEGAQVEKRPLGGASSEDDLLVMEDSLSSIEQEPATGDSIPSQAAAEVEPQPASEAAAPEPPEPMPSKPMTGAQVQTAPTETEGPASIVQQYKTTPEEPAQLGETSMFDAANYEQPTGQPPKKKSGWLVVLWIVLLLALGGGGAFIAYQFNLI